jgi:hypothetical protein
VRKLTKRLITAGAIVLLGATVIFVAIVAADDQAHWERHWDRNVRV